MKDKILLLTALGMPGHSDERIVLASALAWWLEMGVDVPVQDEPRDWLRPAAPKPASAGRNLSV